MNRIFGKPHFSNFVLLSRGPRPVNGRLRGPQRRHDDKDAKTFPKKTFQRDSV